MELDDSIFDEYRNHWKWSFEGLTSRNFPHNLRPLPSILCIQISITSQSFFHKNHTEWENIWTKKQVPTSIELFSRGWESIGIYFKVDEWKIQWWMASWNGKINEKCRALYWRPKCGKSRRFTLRDRWSSTSHNSFSESEWSAYLPWYDRCVFIFQSPSIPQESQRIFQGPSHTLHFKEPQKTGSVWINFGWGFFFKFLSGFFPPVLLMSLLSFCVWVPHRAGFLKNVYLCCLYIFWSVVILLCLPFKFRTNL